MLSYALKVTDVKYNSNVSKLDALKVSDGKLKYNLNLGNPKKQSFTFIELFQDKTK